MTIPANLQDVYAKATQVYTQQQIDDALDQMAVSISQKLENTHPLVLCVLKGGIILTGNLLPRLDFPLELDCVHATRYQGATTGAELHWKTVPSTSLNGRTILIVDDILDRGVTLTALIDFCKEQGAKAVYTAVLLDKVTARLPGGLPTADFTALTIEDRFVFGYGLDYAEYFRNAPGIYEVAPEHQ